MSSEVNRVREWAEEALSELNPDALFMDGLDDAIIGVTVGQAGQKNLVVYDEDLIIKTLMKDEEFSEEECWDHYGFNIQGAYVGDDTPIIIKRFEDVEGLASG